MYAILPDPNQASVRAVNAMTGGPGQTPDHRPGVTRRHDQCSLAKVPAYGAEDTGCPCVLTLRNGVFDAH